jgi:tyrosinase
MRSTNIAAAALLSILSNASPMPQSVGGLRQQGYQGPYFAITGAVGGVWPRLELRALEQTGEMWNLYLLALADFQAMDQKGIASYYQVAGIHGMPWTSWDGVAGTAGDDKSSSQKGYCPHNMLLFGTWHRPYLALFEVRIPPVPTVEYTNIR